MVFIEDFVNQMFDEGKLGREIAYELNVSVSMVSAYRQGSYKPSLDVAKYVFEKHNIVLHPFSEEGLEYELNRSRK